LSEYLSHKEAYAQLVGKTSTEHFKQFVANCASITHLSTLNRIFKDAPHHQPPATLHIDGRHSEDLQSTANAQLGHFFTAQLAGEADHSDPQYVSRFGHDHLHFIEDEVWEVLVSFRADKAPGEDGL